jgi:glycosyltransferase involved in cell wall biosynthesis
MLWRQSKEELVGRLEGFGANVLHCLCESRALFTRWLSRQLNLPYVLTVNSLQGRFSRLFISSRRCVRIIVPAKSIADGVAEVYPGAASRIEQINIGTFVREGKGCFSRPGQLASMVVAHPLRDAGDFENLLGAVRHLAIEGYEFMLVMIGSGRAEREVRRLISGLGLSQIVVGVPLLRPWHSVLAAGDIFIRPRPSDAFNPLLLEAMSVGSAVAGCKGGVDDLIVEGKTAVTFDPDDEISIRKALRGLFDKREFAQQIARGAREYLKENHSVSKMLADTLRVYSEAQNSF